MAAPTYYQGMRTVYDAKTGEAVSLNPIDARERVKCGLATFEPKPEVVPEQAPADPPAEQPSPDQEPA